LCSQNKLSTHLRKLSVSTFKPFSPWDSPKGPKYKADAVDDALLFLNPTVSTQQCVFLFACCPGAHTHTSSLTCFFLRHLPYAVCAALVLLELGELGTLEIDSKNWPLPKACCMDVQLSSKISPERNSFGRNSVVGHYRSET
jgi:hypothetical protein